MELLMGEIVFEAWGKTPRLFRDITITEKIDGTNGAIIIKAIDPSSPAPLNTDTVLATVAYEGVFYDVGAQSRKRLITPKSDNAGFAAWVKEHAELLVQVLGPGRHFGEWWGHKIQRGYGLEKGDRRFSLFNTAKWGHFTDPEQAPNIPGLGVVPILHQGPFDAVEVDWCMYQLEKRGSHAAPGYMNPEGIIVYHSAANQVFKVTLDGDGHKST
jgi:hypothetical protein